MERERNTMRYPDKRWVISQLRNNLTSRTRRPVLDTFIIGSEARGTVTAESDLDIAVIVPKVKGKTSLQLTEQYHSNTNCQTNDHNNI
jgi:predicted nucleotidyltransferase